MNTKIPRWRWSGLVKVFWVLLALFSFINFLITKPLAITTCPEETINIWPGGIIPYEFETETTNNPVTSSIVSKIESQISVWESYTTIDFVPYNSSIHLNYIKFIEDDDPEKDPYSECVGIRGEIGFQIVNIPARSDERVILHELGHVIGLIHEHQRPDRHLYINVDELGLLERFQGPFTQIDSIEYYQEWQYDFESIMHYSANNSIQRGAFTLVDPNPSLLDKIGTLQNLSSEDIRRVNTMYTETNADHRCNIMEEGKPVVLYADIECNSTFLIDKSHNSATETAISTQGPIFNFLRNTSSIKLGHDWSVMVFSQSNGGGASRCITNNMWDLSLDHFDPPNETLEISGNIMSYRVFNNSSCKEGEILACTPFAPTSKETTSVLPLCSDTTPPTPTSSCPAGQNGDYCGATIGANPNVLYTCTAGTYTVNTECSNGCHQNVQGVNDVCNSDTVDYCQQIPWGGAGYYCQGDNLIYCSSSRTTTTSDTCANGCQVNPLFTNDTCIGGSSTSTSSERVRLYSLSNYAGSLVGEFGVNESGSTQPDSNSYSMEIPSGWSVVTWDGDPMTGGNRCWTESVANLQDHSWQLRIDSIQVFDHNVCGASSSGGPEWDIYYYSGDSKWWDTSITLDTAACNHQYPGETLDIDYSSGTPCGTGFSGDNWTGDYYATRYFPEDDYVFHIDHDDKLQLFVNGDRIVLRSGSGSSSVCPEVHLSGNVDLRAVLHEIGGDAHARINWDTDTSICDDVTPPSGEITGPEPNIHTNSSSPILLTANAYDDDSGVAEVKFFLKSDGIWGGGNWTQVGNDTTAPYEYSLDTSLAGHNLPEGFYWAATKVRDNDDNESEILEDENFWTNFIVDRTAPPITPASPTSETPIVMMYPLDLIQESFSFNVSWSGGDNYTAVSELNYDIQYQYNCIGDWFDWLVYRRGTNVKFSGAPGMSYCFRARGIDKAGNVGAWTTDFIRTETPTCNENEFEAKYFDNISLSGDPIHYSCENEINHNWGNGGISFSEGEFGDGGDGAKIVTGTEIDDSPDAEAQGAVGTNILFATNSFFGAGQKIFIHQTKGGTTPGAYEINEIASYAPGEITTTNPLQYDYLTDGNDDAQVIVIRQYTDVTVEAGAVWKPKAWNDLTGGILVFMANGISTIDGTIDASGRGFSGGQSGQYPNGTDDNRIGQQGENISGVRSRSIVSNLNGGGGGPPRETNGEGNGGGGGSNRGNGSDGNRHISTSGNVGQGAINITQTLDPEFTKLFFGGGGGGGGFGDAEQTPIENYGKGGNGGGIIFVKSESLGINDSTGYIKSEGITGQNGAADQAAGGSGAGGTIYLIADQANLGTNKIDTKNNVTASGTSGGGGRGGIGRAKVLYYTSYTGSSTQTVIDYEHAEYLDHFSARWEGNFDMDPSNYKFITRADDGVKLWVEEELIVDDWVDGYSEWESVKYVGSSTKIELEYYENIDNASVQLLLVPGENNPPELLDIPDQSILSAEEFIPINLNEYGSDSDFNYIEWEITGNTDLVFDTTDPSNVIITKPMGWNGSEDITFKITDEWGEYAITTATFSTFENTGCSAGQYFAEYFYNNSLSGDPMITSCESRPDYNWGTGPSPIMAFDNFSVRWTGVETLAAGNYNFSTYSDDGVRLFVNGEQVIDHWENELSTQEAILNLENGNHNVILEYYENIDNAQVQLNINPIVGSAPIPSDIPDGNTDEDTVFPTFDLDDFMTEPDGDLVTWSYSGNTDLNVSIDIDNIVTIIPPADWNGYEDITFFATDETGLVSEDTARFTVNPQNDAPTIFSISDDSLTWGDEYILEVNGNDIDGDPLSYSLTTSPTNMTINSSTGEISWETLPEDVGIHVIDLEVTDGDLTDTTTFTLEVLTSQCGPHTSLRDGSCVAVVNDIIEDGYVEILTDITGATSTTKENARGKIHISRLVYPDSDITRKGYIEWNIGLIPDSATITSVDFKYHGTHNNPDDAQIIVLGSLRPSSTDANILMSAIDFSLSSYLDNWVLQENPNNSVTLGGNILKDFSDRLLDNWFAFGMDYMGDPKRTIGEDSFYASEKSNANPQPTLIVHYTP